jgi:hypothetical protein
LSEERKRRNGNAITRTHPLQTIFTTRTVADADARNPQGTPMTDREKILIALREKPLKAFEIMKRVNIKHQDDCQSLLLKMRDDGAVKFDIHKGHWLAA